MLEYLELGGDQRKNFINSIFIPHLYLICKLKEAFLKLLSFKHFDHGNKQVDSTVSRCASELTVVVKAAYCVGLLDVTAGEAKRRVLHQMVLLLVEAVEIQEVPGHRHSWSGVGLRLQAQSAQEEVLDGLSHTGLQGEGTSWRGLPGGRHSGHLAMVDLAGVSTLPTRRGLR